MSIVNIIFYIFLFYFTDLFENVTRSEGEASANMPPPPASSATPGPSTEPSIPSTRTLVEGRAAAEAQYNAFLANYKEQNRRLEDYLDNDLSKLPMIKISELFFIIYFFL